MGSSFIGKNLSKTREGIKKTRGYLQLKLEVLQYFPSDVKKNKNILVSFRNTLQREFYIASTF